ncbi:hypothetical protein GDO81_004749 [Engystomops pustulosus]|uniref:Uncharacterized protein n=1 Tax=Engystomops pustulosus TaxID=76066 RepID=A0AAV7CI58_ENGPU|nr:hypothetical protein GDO81_004749 [Engystomops pustulosus]
MIKMQMVIICIIHINTLCTRRKPLAFIYSALRNLSQPLLMSGNAPHVNRASDANHSGPAEYAAGIKLF